MGLTLVAFTVGILSFECIADTFQWYFSASPRSSYGTVSPNTQFTLEITLSSLSLAGLSQICPRVSNIASSDFWNLVSKGSHIGSSGVRSMWYAVLDFSYSSLIGFLVGK